MSLDNDSNDLVEFFIQWIVYTLNDEGMKKLKIHVRGWMPQYHLEFVEVSHANALILNVGTAVTTLKKLSHIVLSYPMNLIKENNTIGRFLSSYCSKINVAISVARFFIFFLGSLLSMNSAQGREANSHKPPDRLPYF